MTDERYDEALAQMQRGAAEQAERQRQHRACLRSVYGPDEWDRGTVLIFYPNPNEKDQEIRAAVKIGMGQWTLTARGGIRTWDEMLEKLGLGKILHRMTASEPEIVIEAELPGIRQ
jgi:hypothetical protein